MVLAAGFQVNGINGVLWLLAMLCFLVAAIVAFFVMPRNFWAVGVPAGLFFAALAHLVT